MVITSYFLLALPPLLPPLDFPLTIMNYYYNQAVPTNTRQRGAFNHRNANYALFSTAVRSPLSQCASRLIGSAITLLHLYYGFAFFAR